MASQLAPPPPTDITPDEWRLVETYRQHRGVSWAPARGGGWRLAFEALIALRSLATLTVIGLVLLLAWNFVGVPGQIGQRVGPALERTGQALRSASQDVADVFNPTHPPRYSISQDTEFSALQVFRGGDIIGDSRDYTFALAAIRHRDDAGSADFAEYALLNRQYKVARETKLLGITVRTDRGEQQFILDRGVTFRIGSRLYKVNWLAAGEQQVAIGMYRDPDRFAGKLAFESD